MLRPLAVSLALTLVLEGAFALLWGVKERRDWLLVVLVNVVTNPIVVSLYCLGLDSWPEVAALELTAVAAEWLAYRRWGRGVRPALLFSVCANCFSFFSGMLLNFVIGGL